MKKITKLAFYALSSVIMFSACNDDEDKDPPQVSVAELTQGLNNNEISVTPNTLLTFRWNAVKVGTGDDLSSFEIIQQGANVTIPLPQTFTGRTIPFTSLPNSLSDRYVDTITINAGANMGITEYTFKATDKGGQTGMVTVRVTVGPGTTPLATVKNGMFYHVAGSLQGAWDLVADALVGASGPNANKDMNNTNAAGSPFNGTWKSENNTTYVKGNNFDYDNATIESAAAAYAAGASSTTVTSPAVGDMYIAKIRGGNSYTVIKITALDANDNTCACGNRGKISFEYKK